jgi:hypothetical protein
LCTVEEVDDGCANSRPADQIGSVHDWSMAGALGRLARQAAWLQPQNPPVIVPSSHASLQNSPASVTKQVQASCAHCISAPESMWRSHTTPDAPQNRSFAALGLHTAAASRLGNPAGSIVDSGVIVT